MCTVLRYSNKPFQMHVAMRVLMAYNRVFPASINTVANGRNGIDVDKFDYLVRDSRACGLGCTFQFGRMLDTMRVIDDELCYRAKECNDGTHVCRCPGKSPSHVREPSLYWKLDDSILKINETAPDQENSRNPEI
ncbi:hypothetical protein OROMI_013197 [Orobanche minor]